MVAVSRISLLLALALAALAVPGTRSDGVAKTGGAWAAAVRAQQAYPRTYHIWGTDQDLQALSRYDLVVGYAYWNIRALRARNPSGVFLLSPGLRPGHPRDYRGMAVTNGALGSWRGGRDVLRGGPKLGSIRGYDPYWDALHNEDGSLAVVNSSFDHPGWNLADPAHRGTADLVAQVFAYASKKGGLYRRGWDGVHSDNWIYRIGVSWFYGSRLDTDRDGKVDDYSVLRRSWARGLTRVGALLRAYLPGKIVGGNGNWNVRPGTGTDFRQYLPSRDAYLRSSNYTLLEGLELYESRPDDVLDAAREWLSFRDPWGQRRYFAILHRLAEPGDFRTMRWGLSLATIAGAHYEAYSASHADLLWYDEYDGGAAIRRRHYLGEPISAPIKLPSGVWRRDFRNGIVLNNSTSSPQTVDLQRVFWHLKGVQDPTVNSGTSVSEVTIPARDGLFLLRRQDGSTPRTTKG